jgi:hypothetical protein
VAAKFGRGEGLCRSTGAVASAAGRSNHSLRQAIQSAESSHLNQKDLAKLKTLATSVEQITRQETLRGSVTPEREWWDVLHYHLQVEFLPETRRLKGSNTITFKTLKPGNKMQIDLQPPLAITKITTATRNSNLNEKEMSTG